MCADFGAFETPYRNTFEEAIRDAAARGATDVVFWDSEPRKTAPAQGMRPSMTARLR